MNLLINTKKNRPDNIFSLKANPEPVLIFTGLKIVDKAHPEFEYLKAKSPVLAQNQIRPVEIALAWSWSAAPMISRAVRVIPELVLTAQDRSRNRDPDRDPSADDRPGLELVCSADDLAGSPRDSGAGPRSRTVLPTGIISRPINYSLCKKNNGQSNSQKCKIALAGAMKQTKVACCVLYYRLGFALVNTFSENYFAAHPASDVSTSQIKRNVITLTKGPVLGLLLKILGSQIACKGLTHFDPCQSTLFFKQGL